MGRFRRLASYGLLRQYNWKFFEFLICLILMAVNTSVFADNYEDPELKAAILYKLSHFIHWPNLDKNDINGSYNLCLLGKSKLRKYLEPLNSRKIHNHQIRVFYFKNSENIQGRCHLVFISSPKKAFLATIINNLENSPILTISDIQDFAARGGMIELSSSGEKITFKINLSRAKQVGLKITAPLLDMATLVRE